MSRNLTIRVAAESALRGIGVAVRGERSLRLELAVFVGVVGLSWWLGISRLEWLIIVVVSSVVFAIELLNTSVERLADALHPRDDAAIGRVKDIAAGAVVVAVTGAIMTGAAIFGHRIWLLVIGTW